MLFAKDLLKGEPGLLFSEQFRWPLVHKASCVCEADMGTWEEGHFLKKGRDSDFCMVLLWAECREPTVSSWEIPSSPGRPISLSNLGMSSFHGFHFSIEKL